MATVMTTMKKWQDDYLTLMARVEEPIVRFTGKAADSVAEYVPERPRWEFLDGVPTVTEFVDSQLKFRRMLKAMHPALARLDPPAPVTKRVAAKASSVRRIGAKAA